MKIINRFAKNVLITMVIISLVSMPYEPRVRAAESPFTDIVPGIWYEGVIINTYNKGIVNGYPDGTFNPEGNITRAEMAKIIIKAMGLDSVVYPKLKFTDAKDIPSWAAGYIETAVDKGIIVGYPDGTFGPEALISRAEISSMVVKAIGFDDPATTENVFADNGSIPEWARAFVAKAYDLGIIEGYNEGENLYFRATNNATRAEACAIIDRMCILNETWKIPDIPIINGTTDLDMTITKYVNEINNDYIPGSASRYYDAAIAQECLPPKYTITPENRDQSIVLISEDLKWNQGKIDKLWQVCSEKSKEYGNVIDPRLLLAVIMIEGTGSFDTNRSPHSPSSVNGGYIQPDFDADLTKAFNDHIFGKIWAYPNYANEFEAASVAAQGTEFTVNTDQMTPPATKVVTYTGKGDLFEYINNNVPRIRWAWDTSTNQYQYVVSYGVYAGDYNWCNNLRGRYEVMAGTGAAAGYSEFLKANPIPWPSGLPKPTGSFVLTNIGQGWPYWYSGYPMIKFF